MKKSGVIINSGPDSLTLNCTSLYLKPGFQPKRDDKLFSWSLNGSEHHDMSVDNAVDKSINSVHNPVYKNFLY